MCSTSSTTSSGSSIVEIDLALFSDEAGVVSLSIQMSTPSRAFSERPPLTPTTNDARAESPSLFATAKTTQSNFILRHQVPFHPHLDSSESIPSGHASIYEASIFNPSGENLGHYSSKSIGYASNDNINLEDVGQSEGSQADNILDHEEERRAADEMAWNNCVPAVHSPHRLEPITEKNSLATLQTKGSRTSVGPQRPRILANMSSQATLQSYRKTSNLSLRPQPSSSTLPSVPCVRPTHRKSFSLPSFSRRSEKSSSSSVTLTPSNYVGTLPRIPKRPPPERKPTPPGLPTFNTPAAINYRLPAPPIRFRDHFRSSKVIEDYRRQTRALPRGVVMRGDNGELIRGRWRAAPSGHGPTGQHPWLALEETANMTMYPGHDGGVRVRPGGSAIGPPIQDSDQVKKGGKWWDKLVVMCCGIAREEDGEVGLQNMQHQRSPEPAPLFVGATNTSVPHVDVCV